MRSLQKKNICESHTFRVGTSDDTFMTASLTDSPAPPTSDTTVQVNPTTVLLSWAQSDAVTGYWIYHVSAGGEDSGSSGLITGNCHILHDLQQDLEYNITVIAIGAHLPSDAAKFSATVVGNSENPFTGK